MMFKKEMAELIIQGKKTETRRLQGKSKKNYKVGSIQPIQINYRQKAIGHIKITKSFWQELGDMTQREIEAEGFRCWSEFMQYLDDINKTYTMPNEVVHVYCFQFIKNEKEKVE